MEEVIVMLVIEGSCNLLVYGGNCNLFSYLLFHWLYILCVCE